MTGHAMDQCPASQLRREALELLDAAKDHGVYPASTMEGVAERVLQVANEIRRPGCDFMRRTMERGSDDGAVPRFLPSALMVLDHYIPLFEPRHEARAAELVLALEAARRTARSKLRQHPELGVVEIRARWDVRGTSQWGGYEVVEPEVAR